MLPARLSLASALLAGFIAAAPGVPGDDAVRIRGEGPGIVLLSGLLGGTARLEPLSRELAARGFRVVAIDPYRLATAAPDVSFAGLAREVEAVLAKAGIEEAIVVAHGHAGGIALRLAADQPRRVHQVVLIEGGLLESTRTQGVSRALDAARWIARFPGGRWLIRSKLASGIRANSGDRRWVTDEVVRDYVDPLVASLPAATTLAHRLAEAQEPEATQRMLSRVRAPILIVLGGAAHESAPSPSEIERLRHRASVRTLPGVGHFVHEEALSALVGEVEVFHARRAANLRDRARVPWSPPHKPAGQDDDAIELREGEEVLDVTLSAATAS